MYIYIYIYIYILPEMMIYADRVLLLFIVLTKKMSNHIHLINQPIMMIYLKKGNFICISNIYSRQFL